MAFAASPLKAIRERPPASAVRFVALYDPRFVLRGHSDGIGDFFAAWPELEDRESDVPAPATAFVRSQWAELRAEGEVDRTTLFLPDLLLHLTEVRGGRDALIAATFGLFAVRDPVRAAERRFHLTPREVEVAKLLLRGMRTPEIAHSMGISEMTIADYAKRLRFKTQARTQSGMIAALLGWGASSRVGGLDSENPR
jgi:DNA-binding CsgD family transcriptional regulator